MERSGPWGLSLLRSQQGSFWALRLKAEEEERLATEDRCVMVRLTVRPGAEGQSNSDGCQGQGSREMRGTALPALV